jgi:glycosyltransferase involved in cell wall biosynthesis
MDRRGISRGRDLKSILKRPAAIRLSKILCVSDYVRDQASGVFGSRAERIHHFVNTSRFRPDPAVRWHVRHELGDETKFVVLIVAQLIKDKGLDVALRAAEKLPADVVLWVVGGGPEQDQLKAMAQRLGLAARARFLGPRRNVEPLMQAADCAVCPSVWAEAAGLVNIEAPACGLPAVASRIGGIPEFVEDGRNGFLFTAGDHNELAERIRRLRDDPPLRQRLSQDARTIAVERHSTENLLPQHMAIYRTAAARRDRLNGQGESSRGL